MKINECTVHAIRKIGEGLPKVNLEEEETHKLKSLGVFLFMTLVIIVINRWGR